MKEGHGEMRKHITQNENGFSLLLVFAVLVIFTILGLSLITITTNGMAKNQTREDYVQSKDLADKGIEYLSKDIQTELEEFINPGTIGKAQFKEKLNQMVNDSRLSCPTGGIEIPGETGKTHVCIDSKKIEDVYFKNEDGKMEIQELRKKVPIVSTGIVDGKESVSTTTVIFGTDTVPDQLRYAVSTNNDGNLYLHGGIDIQGDIKTDGNLILSQQATWFTGDTPVWQPSVASRLSPGPGSTTPKIIFTKSNRAVYKLTQFGPLASTSGTTGSNKDKGNKPGGQTNTTTTKEQYYENHINGTKLDSDLYKKYSPSNSNDQKDISNLFFNSPKISILTNSTLQQDTVEITKTITDKYKHSSNKLNYTDNLTITTSDHATAKLNKTDVVFVSATTKTSVQETYTYFENVCVKKSKKNKCQEWKQVQKTGTRSIPKDSYMHGSMNILGDSTKNKDITLKGTYFIYGDLTIKNVNLTADAILYVQGKVDISNSTIKGINDNSTLIIFGNDNIDMYNMSVDRPETEASKIKGFFYSKENFIMYGVGSNINLTGGISAQRIILTGVRGDTASGYLSAEKQGELKDGIPKQYARLKIIYDENLISTYTQFKRDKEEEYIKALNPPETIERKN